MKKISFRLLIRRFVLTTSFPPFIKIYRLFYELVIHLAIRIFKKYPEINAVYLRRGSAKGEILPLISDIDFAVIVNGINEEDRKELLNNYDRLAKATTLLDKTLEVYDKETFFNNYEINNYFQYRFMEGKETWKLLYGEDYLAELPELPIEKMYGGFFTEIKVWWTIFEWSFFQNRKYNHESITRNNICYKTVSEILKMNLALNEGILEFSRKNALELSIHSFKEKELNFLKKLENISRKNFRPNESNILDESKNFLLNYLDGFYKELQNHPYTRSLKEITQKVVCPKEEQLLNEEDEDHIKHLVGFLKENWSYTYRGSHLISSVYFNLDEFLFMVQINPKKIPTTQELTAFNLFHRDAKPELSSRVKLFLLFPNAAFQIDTDDFNKSWQSILIPLSNPDVFDLLGRSEFKLDGEDYQANEFPVWTPPVEHFFCHEKMLFFELLKNQSIYKLNNLDFLRIFWKTAQLVVMNNSVNKEEIFYPLTLSAIEKALIAYDLSLPKELKILADAYRNELKGEPDNISLLIPVAVNYLKEIG